MADEVTVIEMPQIRGKTPIMVRPKLAVQVLDIDGTAASAFSSGTRMVGIRTTTDCNIEFTNLDGTAPDGAGAGDGVEPLLAADGWQFYDIRPGDQVIAVS